MTTQEVRNTLMPFIEEDDWIRPFNQLARIKHLFIIEIRRVFPGNSRVSRWIAEHPNPPYWEWDDYWIFRPASYGTSLYATLAMWDKEWIQGEAVRKEIERVQRENAYRTLTDMAFEMVHYTGRPQKELDAMWARFKRIEENKPNGPPKR